MDHKKISQIIRGVREQGRYVLVETEGNALLEAMGIELPEYRFIRNSAEAATDLKLPGDKVVIKVISPEILHKTEVGGVKIVANRKEEIIATIREMERKFTASRLHGFTINEFVQYDPAIGRELLLGMRWTEDFGPVVSFNAGGIYAEFLAKNFKPGSDVAIFSPHLMKSRAADAKLPNIAISEIVGGGYRNLPPLIPVAKVNDVLGKFLEVSMRLMPDEISEFEINPMVIAKGAEPRLVALDVLIKLRSQTYERPPTRPFAKLHNLLEPKSAAIIGVSEKMNPGHHILNNLIREGFDRKEIFVIKPGSPELEGCRCVPDIASLPKKVDLLILSVAAAQVPEIVTEVAEHQKAESLIVIPGGLEEKQGTESIVAGMRAALRKSRESAWQGPVINGGNCLGIRSIPGKYNTLFIPGHKLPIPETAPVSSLALISQSGAFAVSRINKLGRVNPKYAVSIGNQMDLTIGDYLTYLKDDRSIQVYAVYVEGFKPLDGLRFLEAAAEITAQGRTVILYRAGRTTAGAKASASHTASIAGDYTVTRELCRQAGIVTADSLSDFDNLMKMFTLLKDKRPRGWRLGAVSNAGCECVAIADNLGRFELAHPSGTTARRLEKVLESAGIANIVDVHNPLDLTPMANDAAYDESFQAFLDDDGVDVGIIGVVPLTPALNSLPKDASPTPRHKENLLDNGSIAMRLISLISQGTKPWVAVVDAGALYDPLAHTLEENGVPTFREADTALRLLNVFCETKQR